MPAFKIEETGRDTILYNKYGVYSRNELIFQLREGHLTVKELGKIYNLIPCQISHVMRSLGINYHNPLNDTRIMNASISPEMHQVLLGTLLGDAYMKEPKAYHVCHGINQTDYLYHLAEVLGPFVATIRYKKKKTDESKDTSKFSFWTFRHDNFVPYFNRFYSHGKRKKYFLPESVAGLEARGLAYWYMDDGKYSDYGSHLSVGDITEAEGTVLRTYLKNKFNLETTFQVHDAANQYHTIYIRAESRSGFFSLIGPYMIPSMKYKLTGDPPPVDQPSDSDIVSRHTALCMKIQKNIRFSGDPEIQQQVEAGTGQFDIKKNYILKIRKDMKNREQRSIRLFRILPPEDELQKLFMQGMTDQQIASVYGFGRNRIGAIRRGLGLKRKVCRSHGSANMMNF